MVRAIKVNNVVVGARGREVTVDSFIDTDVCQTWLLRVL